ncbi:MAG TPA: NYN domain-containing protein [Nitrospiraceae bacterium]|nr:NYN domain-containing protein [Nitrospiraceae bacterium]
MSVHLIIDGYNLLGRRGQVGPESEMAREFLVRELTAYRQRKGHPMTLVFDGWRQGLPVERHEHRAGVQVIYSKKGERADQVIQRLTSEFGSECAVVSSDREVADFARARGAFVIGAAEFELKLHADARGVSRSAAIPPRKDAEEACPPLRREKKGNPRKLPKALRKRNRRLQGF